jgi:DNA-binding NtrC family response regulator
MSDSVRVLLVEDDPAVLLGTQQTLQLAGFEVEPFADAEAAIPSIFPDVPAIIVCDVKLRWMAWGCWRRRDRSTGIWP